MSEATVTRVVTKPGPNAGQFQPGNRAAVHGGAPVNNANHLKSGKRAWTAVKRLPKGAGMVRRALYAERAELEQATVVQHGEINLYHAALIQSGLRHSGRAQLLERWLRIEEGLSVTDRLAILKEIGSATDSRDKCLQRLGLDVRPADRDPWAALDVASTTGTADAIQSATPEETSQGHDAGLANTMEIGPDPVAHGSPPGQTQTEGGQGWPAPNP